MTTGHDGWRALSWQLRPLARAMWLLERAGGHSVQKVAASSLEDRQKGKPARWACRPVRGDVAVAARRVPTRAGSVVVRTYRRPAAGAALPVLVYLHGGGWIMGGLDGSDPFCRRVALSVGVAVVSIDYRLAPEHRYPAALEDCADVLAWLRTHDAELDLDPTRIAVAGDSAGGNLAAALTLLDRGSASPLLAQVLLYPGLDLTMTSAFFTSFRGPGLTQGQCRQLVELYLGPDGDRRDPLASPLLAPDLAELPPALVVTAGADILADDGRRYVGRLLEAGGRARLLHYPRVPHAFFGFDRLLPEASAAAREVADFLRTELGLAPVPS